MHRIPTTQLWVWPSWGGPDVNPSWGFRALLWPFWAAGGEWGLLAWRILTTLAAFTSEKTVYTNMGQAFSVFTIIVAAAEAAVGLAIIIAFYRMRKSIMLDEANLMKG